MTLEEVILKRLRFWWPWKKMTLKRAVECLWSLFGRVSQGRGHSLVGVLRFQESCNLDVSGMRS